MIRRKRLFWLALAAVTWGCGAGHKTPAEATAGAFMEAYYVNADLEEASRLADGLALEKVKGGQSLREGLAIDPGAHHPKIHFKIAGSKEGAEEADYLYDVEFRPEKSDAVRKTARLKLRLRGGQWKVTQFTDHDR
ncbi:MAG TPA: hypothetical protein VLJ37_01270 [bacterium]|nr:hypothetical protein [bacterium]